MIHLLSLIGNDVTLLGNFLQHYYDAGIGSVLLGVNLDSLWDPTLETVQRVARNEETGALVVHVEANRHFSTWRQKALRVAICQNLPPDDWVIQADLDEFQIWPGRSIPSILELVTESHVTGHFVDRIAEGGFLKPVERGESIWRQFPLEYPVTGRILGGDTRKVVAFRARLADRVSVGQHCLDPLVEGLGAPYPVDIPVAHFKWTYGVMERLKKRAADMSASGEEWGIESERGLRYLADARIPIEALTGVQRAQTIYDVHGG